MFIGSMLNAFVVDLLLDEESSTSSQEASSSKLDTLTKPKLSHKRTTDKPAANSRPGSVVDVSELGPFDVLSGRGREAWNNQGNNHFRVVISGNVQRYIEARTCHEKTNVIMSVVKYMRQELGARFYKETPGGNSYRLLDKRETHEKVGHALRDMAKSKSCRGNKPSSSQRQTSIGSSKSSHSDPTVDSHCPRAASDVARGAPHLVPRNIPVPSMTQSPSMEKARRDEAPTSANMDPQNPFHDLFDYIAKDPGNQGQERNSGKIETNALHKNEQDLNQQFEPIPLSRIHDKIEEDIWEI